MILVKTLLQLILKDNQSSLCTLVQIEHEIRHEMVRYTLYFHRCHRMFVDTHCGRFDGTSDPKRKTGMFGR
jgi:hypothetical protein